MAALSRGGLLKSLLRLSSTSTDLTQQANRWKPVDPMPVWFTAKARRRLSRLARAGTRRWRRQLVMVALATSTRANRQERSRRRGTPCHPRQWRCLETARTRSTSSASKAHPSCRPRPRQAASHHLCHLKVVFSAMRQAATCRRLRLGRSTPVTPLARSSTFEAQLGKQLVQMVWVCPQLPSTKKC